MFMRPLYGLIDKILYVDMYRWSVPRVHFVFMHIFELLKLAVGLFLLQATVPYMT